MSDEIDTSTGDAAFAYLESNGVPWHGLGTAMPDEKASLEEWLKASKLEWEAKTVPIYFGNFIRFDQEFDKLYQRYFEIKRIRIYKSMMLATRKYKVPT